MAELGLAFVQSELVDEYFSYVRFHEAGVDDVSGKLAVMLYGAAIAEVVPVEDFTDKSQT